MDDLTVIGMVSAPTRLTFRHPYAPKETVEVAVTCPVFNTCLQLCHRF